MLRSEVPLSHVSSFVGDSLNLEAEYSGLPEGSMVRIGDHLEVADYNTDDGDHYQYYEVIDFEVDLDFPEYYVAIVGYIP